MNEGMVKVMGRNFTDKQRDIQKRDKELIQAKIKDKGGDNNV